MVSPSKLVHKSTCRIVCDQGKSIGTGFLFAFMDENDNEKFYPLLITNKHVIAGASTASIRFNVKSATQPEIKFFDIQLLNVTNQFLMHPENNVDLCALPLAESFNKMQSDGFEPDTFFFNENNIIGLEQLTPIEEVYMIGYPNGLWDEVNNRPITRKGITASDINQNWNGKPEFMIDMACFGGSSGSPVFIMNEGSYVIDAGIAMGTRFLLAGILYAGPLVNINGTVDIINVPTSSVAVTNSKIMMNLGFVINSSKILSFKKLLGI
jgi:hypothetical protein